MEFALDIVMLLVPVLAGKATQWITELIKMVRGVLDDAPAWAKQAVALVVASVLAYVAALLNAPQIVDGDPGTIANAVLAWVIAMLFHNGQKLADEV